MIFESFCYILLIAVVIILFNTLIGALFVIYKLSDDKYGAPEKQIIRGFFKKWLQRKITH